MNEDILYTHRARPLRAIDGDTIEVVVDTRFGTTITIDLRLEGIDTPELRSKDPGERARAADARLTVDLWLLIATSTCPHSWPLRIRTYKERRTFTRYRAEVWSWDGDNLVEHLHEHGHEIIKETA